VYVVSPEDVGRGFLLNVMCIYQRKRHHISENGDLSKYAVDIIIRRWSHRIHCRHHRKMVILSNPLSTSSEDGDLIKSTVDIIGRRWSYQVRCRHIRKTVISSNPLSTSLTTTLHSYAAKDGHYEFKHGLRPSIVVLVVPSLALPSVSNRMSIPEGGRTLSAFHRRLFQFCLWGSISCNHTSEYSRLMVFYTDVMEGRAASIFRVSQSNLRLSIHQTFLSIRTSNLANILIL
jgi:hypothetical protein